MYVVPYLSLFCSALLMKRCKYKFFFLKTIDIERKKSEKGIIFLFSPYYCIIFWLFYR